MVNPNRFYTYAYLREDRTPYYIGKGSGRRIFVNKGKPCKKPKDKSRIIFLKQNITEEEAFRHETYMIFVFGRKDLGTGILHNRSDGGEGICGVVRTKEWKRKQSEAMSGENHPNYGKKRSEEYKQKMREKMKGENNPNYGKPKTEEWKQMIREKVSGEKHPLYGIPKTEEEKRNLSEKMMGKTASKKTRQKMSAAKKGKNNPKSKTYILTSPQGLEYIVTGMLEKFCVENRIEYGAMKKAARKKQTTPRRNGWSIRELIMDKDS